MIVPNSNDILAVTSDGVADFIQKHATAKTLSTMVKQLNNDLLNGDESASEMASKALNHLGFSDRAKP